MLFVIIAASLLFIYRLILRTLSDTLDCLLMREEHTLNRKLTPEATACWAQCSPTLHSIRTLTHWCWSYTFSARWLRRFMHTSKMRRHSLCIAPQSRQSHTIHQTVNRFRSGFRVNAKNHKSNEIRTNKTKLKTTNFKLVFHIFFKVSFCVFECFSNQRPPIIVFNSKRRR